MLFLVDLEELGIQAGDAFKETKMGTPQRFAEIFGIKELGQRELDSDTRVHISTVQAMVQRLLLGDEQNPPPQAEAGAGKPSRRGRKPAAAHPDQARLGLESKTVDVASDPLPPDQLSQLLQECGPLSEKALLAASELEPDRFLRQLQLELQAGTICEDLEEGERVLVGG